ncbi:T9SS type A sorting domain-containing protein, partial [candidate division WOR-3 bacterium]|nr:T9SS type A sorting domain-containing protein [candidate division WOR-3 bacterium]
DGDGDIDLSVSVNGADSVSVIFNNGNGTYTSLTKYHVGDNPWGIKSADFDLDGDLDLACANFNSNNVSVLLNTGTGVKENPKVFIPKPFLKVYPNPFTDRVDVRFSIGLKKGNDELKIYDVSGRLVRSFSVPTDYSVLHNTIMWDGKDSKGKMVPSGIYFCKLKIGKTILTRKFLRVR